MTRSSTAVARRMISAAFVGACALAIVIALVPLAFILFFVMSEGIQSLNSAFFLTRAGLRPQKLAHSG